MTLEEIRSSDKVLLTPKDVATALGIDEQGIRVRAHENPAALGFPVVVTGRKGRTVKIPRVQFLRFMGIDV